jgi:peptidoglycan/LPS O-acetylase OafA/YrhL
MTASMSADIPTRGEATSPRTEAGPYRRDVDGLRAVAILSVLTFHAFPQWLPGGFIGVDVFFVISGFLISRIVFTGLSAGTFTFSHFYARRVRRIFPSLTVILIVALGLGWTIQRQVEFAQLGKHVAAGAGFLSNIALWLESGYFDSSADTKPLLNLWSLGIEEQFYIVFPLLVFLAWRLRIARMPLLLVISAASFATSLVLVTRDPSAAFYLPHARGWELMAGCLLAQADIGDPSSSGEAGASTTRAPGPVLRNVASLAGVLLIATGLVLIDASRSFPGAWALLPVAGAASLIWAGPDAFINRRVLARPLMVWIGLISFQLYLWHWPLLAFLHIARPEDSDITSRALVLAACFPLAWATYAWIDKPVRTGPPSRTKVTSSCVALALAGFASFGVYLQAGFPQHTPDALTALANYSFPMVAAYRKGSCFLEPNQGFGQFGECTQRVPGSKEVVLWGDSHAAHLFPGLEEAARDRFTLTQLTAGSCPPILDTDFRARPKCRAINDGVLARIARERPHEVILSCYWPEYAWQKLPVTIDRLLAAGVERVLVVGPGPLWPSQLPGLLYARAKADGPSHRFPRRLSTGTDEKQISFDEQLAKAIARPGVSYVSVLSILCNESGCLTSTRDDASSITTWDMFHLTSEGSKYVVAHFPEGSLP